MSGERIFLDTWFILALLNARDAYHTLAHSLWPRTKAAHQLVTTEAVLVETCNGLARFNRDGAATFARACMDDPRYEIVPLTERLLDRALLEYSTVADKEWGLTDCISFAVMRERGLQLVATGDHHFRQAGFVPLVDGPPVAQL